MEFLSKFSMVGYDKSKGLYNYMNPTINDTNRSIYKLKKLKNKSKIKG